MASVANKYTFNGTRQLFRLFSINSCIGKHIDSNLANIVYFSISHFRISMFSSKNKHLFYQHDIHEKLKHSF